MAAVPELKAPAAWHAPITGSHDPLLPPPNAATTALLLAAMEVGLLDDLGKGPRSLTQLQRRLGLHREPTADLLDALVDLGWLDRAGDGARALYLGTRRMQAALAGHVHGALGVALQLWQAPWATTGAGLADLLRGHITAAARVEDRSPDVLREGLASLHGVAMAPCLALRQGTRMLVVQGGAGRLAAAMAQAHPQVQCVALETDTDLARAAQFLDTAGMPQRVSLQALAQCGPARQPWPDCDVVVLYPLLLPMAKRQRAARLAQARAALRPGGLLIVVEHWVDAHRRRSADPLTLSLLRRAAGKPVHLLGQDQWLQLARAAGFEALGAHPLAAGASALMAQRVATDARHAAPEQLL